MTATPNEIATTTAERGLRVAQQRRRQSRRNSALIAGLALVQAVATAAVANFGHPIMAITGMALVLVQLVGWAVVRKNVKHWQGRVEYWQRRVAEGPYVQWREP